MAAAFAYSGTVIYPTVKTLYFDNILCTGMSQVNILRQRKSRSKYLVVISSFCLGHLIIGESISSLVPVMFS